MKSFENADYLNYCHFMEIVVILWKRNYDKKQVIHSRLNCH